MSDRELMELAAKAAGVIGNYVQITSDWGEIHVQSGWTHFSFNPIRNDGDAFHLAITLRISVEFKEHGVITISWRDKWENLICLSTLIGDDAAETIRRAITHAASRIGESML